MTDTNAAKRITPAKGFVRHEEIYVATYDFAVEGGATANDIMLVTPSAHVAVSLLYMYCETALTSGGSATLIVGLDGVGSENQFLSSTAYTAFTAGLIVAPTSALYQPVASGANVLMRIGTAALTAGKIHFVFKVHAITGN